MIPSSFSAMLGITRRSLSTTFFLFILVSPSAYSAERGVGVVGTDASKTKSADSGFYVDNDLLEKISHRVKAAGISLPTNSNNASRMDEITFDAALALDRLERSRATNLTGRIIQRALAPETMET